MPQWNKTVHEPPEMIMLEERRLKKTSVAKMAEEYIPFQSFLFSRFSFSEGEFVAAAAVAIGIACQPAILFLVLDARTIYSNRRMLVVSAPVLVENAVWLG